MANSEDDNKPTGQEPEETAEPAEVKSKGQLLIDALRGTADLPFTTDEIMAMTRGELD